jgi:hypothetical protein
MATMNKVDVGGMHTLSAADPSFARTIAPLPGQPLAAPANHTVTVAAKLALAAGTEVCVVSMVAGGAYAISGLSDTANIAVGAGWYIAEGQSRDVPVGSTAGVRHTHLLVIEHS